MNVCQSPRLVEEIFNAKLEMAEEIEDKSFSFFLSFFLIQWPFVERKATIETSHRRQPSGQKRTQNTHSVLFISCEARYVFSNNKTARKKRRKTTPQTTTRKKSIRWLIDQLITTQLSCSQ
jgi:hypothetical protein